MSILDRHNNEDRAAAEDLRNPTMRAEEIASLKGVSLRTAQRWIERSGLGVPVHNASPGRPALGIPIAKLADLQRAIDEHNSLIGAD